MVNINSISDLCALVRGGFNDWTHLGDVNVKYYGDLVQFNYNQKCQFAGRWNAFEMMSRGLILNSITGEIVARPFEKFFNFGERGRYPKGHIKNVFEKVDGSLGIAYRHNGQMKIATRGSLDSDQAKWATEFLNQRWPNLIDEIETRWTLLFEIIYPENRVVIDYGNRSDLVLLAIRDRFTGEYGDFWNDLIPLADALNFSAPDYFGVNSITDLIATGGHMTDLEGWVIEFSSGERAKLKTDWYKELHKFVFGVNFNRVLESVRLGSYQQMIDGIPDEFIGQVQDWYETICRKMESTRMEVIQLYAQAPTVISKEDRKKFAEWVFATAPNYAKYLFALLDDKPINELILRYEFEDTDGQ